MAALDIATDELVARATEGDADALAELLEFVGPRIRDGLRIDPLWQASLDADDVMQTSYMETFLRISSLETRTAAGFRAWLSRIAENNLRDAIRGLERAKRPDPRMQVRERPMADSCSQLLEQLGWSSHTASRDALLRESVTLLRQALARLPESYRAVVELYDLEGRTIERVAEAMGRSAGAAYMLRARAHDRLREQLGVGRGSTRPED